MILTRLARDLDELTDELKVVLVLGALREHIADALRELGKFHLRLEVVKRRLTVVLDA